VFLQTDISAVGVEDKEDKMRIFLNIVAVLLILLGSLWFLQGMNFLQGNVMSGQPQWVVIGGLAALVGIGLLVVANRRKGSLPKA
jgi:hypothetical protein